MNSSRSHSSVVFHGVQRRMISVVIFSYILDYYFFCFVVAICDLVHAVEAMYGIH